MPLIYQGRLAKKTVASASAALRIGNKRLGDAKAERVDARLCWESPDALVECEQYLPADSSIFWMDVAAHADADALHLVPTWLESLERGHVSLMCLKSGFEAEVRITLPGLPPERYDHDNYESRFGYDSQQVVVKSVFMASAKDMSKEQREFAASRVRCCFEQVCADTVGDQPTYAHWAEANSQATRIDGRLREAEEVTRAPLPFRLNQESRPITFGDVEMRHATVRGCPTDFVLETSPTHTPWAHHLWTQMVTMLPQLDIIVVRCGGPRKDLMAVLDQLDLYHYHPHRNNHQFGMSTLHGETALAVDTVSTLLNSKQIGRAIADWDVKWSGLRFDLEGMPTQDLGRSSSHYLIRSDSARSLDRLLINLPCEDPTTTEFRSARRQLAAEYGDVLARESSWEYIGAPVHTALGTRYRTLENQLNLARLNAIESSDPIPAIGGPNMMDALPRFLGKSAAKAPFVEQVQDAVTAALPGFKFDRKAHVTDKYFMEYVRRVMDGYQVIQVRRQHEPQGFELRFAVTQYRLPFEDVVSSTRYAVPGRVIELSELIPERPDGWVFRSQRALVRQLKDVTDVLTIRARPFFAASETILRQHAQDHNEDNS